MMEEYIESVVGFPVPVVVLYVLLFFLFIFGLKTFLRFKNMIIIVPQGYEVIVERFGSFSRKLGQGVHWTIPLLETKKIVTWSRVEEIRTGTKSYVQNKRYVFDKIPIFEQLYDFPEYRVISNDLLNITVNGMLIYRIVDSKKAAYAISDLYLAFHKLIETSLRSTISKMKVIEVIQRKNEVESKVKEDLTFIRDQWGIDITKFDIQEVTPPEKYVESNRQIEQQERLLRTKISQKESEKKCQILEEETKLQIETLAHKRFLEKAKHEKAIKELQIDSEYYEKKKEIQHIKEMLASGVDQHFLEVLEKGKAWKSVAQNPQKTLVVPYDFKWLALNSIQSTILKNEKE